jgi:hypothetical protein
VVHRRSDGSSAGMSRGAKQAGSDSGRRAAPGQGGAGPLHATAGSQEEPTSQPELGTNTASLGAPNRPLSGSVAFLGHLGLNTVQKSKGKAKNPLNGARQ